MNFGAIILLPEIKKQMRTGIIIRYTGVSLVMIAAMMAMSAAIAIFNGYDNSASPLIISAVITFVTGFYPMIFVRSESGINPREGVAIVVLSWLACCIFGMIPYLCYGGEFTLVNAFFESVSGFTTTGASILDDIEALPAGLLFWRTSTAWIGGLGIVTFFSLVIPRSKDTLSVLSRAELSDITLSQSSRQGKPFVKTIMSVYMFLTVTCALSLKFAGLGWFDAVTNAMSTCSTCGFCVRNASIAAYDNVAVEMIIMAFMSICGISFMLLSSLVIGGGLKCRDVSTTTAAFLSFLLIATILVTANLHFNAHEPLLDSIRAAVFQISSIATTTGFATVDTNVWPTLSIMVLIVASLICGCSGSTSGGIKMDRVVLLSSYIRNSFRTAINPRRIVQARVDGRQISERNANEAMKFVLVYAFLILVGSVVNILFGLDMRTGVSAAIACLGNVGPGLGEVGSMGNYADLPSMLKMTNSLLMIAGRLEIFPILSFVGLSVSR